MNEDLFGRRLRSERERRRITLESIATSTKIGIGLLKGLERDDLSRWPSGLFRRAFIRSYATAIGLDADEIVREFLERYPDPEPQTNDQPSAVRNRMRHPKTVLRLTLADGPQPFLGGRILNRIRNRLAAAAWDAGAMLALALIAFLCLDRFWAPLGVFILCYQVGSILILGNTPGVYLFAPGGSEKGPGASRPAGEHGLTDLSAAPTFERTAAS